MKTLQSASWNFRWQFGFCCSPKDKHFSTIACLGVPKTPNQQWFIEMREEVLSSVRAQISDTRRYELSDLVDTDFSWEDPVVDMDSVYWHRNDTSFSPSIFDIFQMGSAAANPITVDDEEDKEKSAPTTTTTTKTFETPRLLRSRPFGTRLENLPDSVYRFLFRSGFFVFMFDIMYVFFICK